MKRADASNSFSPLEVANRLEESTQISTGIMQIRISVMEFGRFTCKAGPNCDRIPLDYAPAGGRKQWKGHHLTDAKRYTHLSQRFYAGYIILQCHIVNLDFSKGRPSNREGRDDQAKRLDHPRAFWATGLAYFQKSFAKGALKATTTTTHTCPAITPKSRGSLIPLFSSTMSPCLRPRPFVSPRRSKRRVELPS
jgi:hypothetical protein